MYAVILLKAVNIFIFVAESLSKSRRHGDARPCCRCDCHMKGKDVGKAAGIEGKRTKTLIEML